MHPSIPLIRLQPLPAHGPRGPVDQVNLLWRYRWLVRNLVARELQVRYRNSVLGLAWSLLNPLLLALVLTFVFEYLLRTAPVGSPFPVFVLTGVLAWTFFATSVSGSMGAVVNSAAVITRVYFPRDALPVATVLSNGVNFLIAVVVLILACFAFGIFASATWFAFPIVFVGETLFALGIGMIFASINVYFRDTQFISDALLLCWFFLTPIFYDLNQVAQATDRPNLDEAVLLLNPMAAYVTMYRDIFLLHVVPARS